MKAILMAAGMGTRISAQTNKPKSLLPLGNESLLKHSVKLLQSNNIDVSIILGYKSELIRHELEGMNVTFYENPFYKITNSIASLWFARDALKDEDILLINADIFYSQEILDLLDHLDEDVIMLGDVSRTKLGDYFFKCFDHKLIDYGKELKLKDRTHEYVGIAKIKKEFLFDFKEQLEFLISQGKYHYWWENTLYTLSSKKEIFVQDVCGKFWGEVDTKEDYHRILDYLNKR